MEACPADILVEIFGRLRARNNVALVCRRWHEVDRLSRRKLLTGRRLNPPESALAALCSRFSNLSTLSITYGGWTSEMGKQVDDACLKSLCTCCTHLSDLKLSFCSFITDVGMVNLTGCQQLKAVRLEFTPCVTGRGLLSLVSGCCSLKLLHINRLMNVRVVEWLQFIGNNRCIESLGIRNCKGISETDLQQLGVRGWQNLREFFFEVDVVHGPTGDYFGHNGRGAGLLEGWKFVDARSECCPNLQNLSLTNCLSRSGTGVAWLLSQCKSVDKLYLDTCVGIHDEDLILFARQCTQVKLIHLKFPTHPSVTVPLRLSDAALLGVAQCCHSLEILTLSFSDIDPLPAFTEAGLTAIVESCTRLRHLSLASPHFFKDSTMMIVSQSESLQVLELMGCNELTDAGMMLVGQSNLKKLKISMCFRLTNTWLVPLKTMKTLRYLSVKECPKMSLEGVRNAAQVVFFEASGFSCFEHD